MHRWWLLPALTLAGVATHYTRFCRRDNLGIGDRNRK